MENNDFKLTLLQYAISLVGKGFTLNEKGEYEVKPERFPTNPNDLKQIYDRLIEIFAIS